MHPSTVKNIDDAGIEMWFYSIKIKKILTIAYYLSYVKTNANIFGP